jgi:hypothetical protein
MRRGVASLLFIVAATCLALAAGGWWLQRVAFHTVSSSAVVDEVLEDARIRDEVARVVASAASETVGVPRADLRTEIEGYLAANDPEIRDALATVIADSHARLIGVRDEPVQITGDQLVPIVRDQRAAALPPVTLPVAELRALSATRVVLGWFVPIAAIAGAVALLLGLVAHPRKSDAVFGIGMFCIFAAVAAVLLGFVIPTFLVPAISDEMWTAVIPAVVKRSLPFVLGAAVVLIAGGTGLILGSAAVRRRRAWSTPVSVNRYTDQRRWS